MNTKMKNLMLSNILNFISLRRWTLPLGLIVLYFITFAFIFPDVFLSAYNLTSMLLEFSVPALLTVGMTINLIGGEIDLSLGYATMFSVVFSAYLIVLGVPTIFALLITVIFTLIVGYIVGILVSRVGVNSFIATLGSGMMFFGLGLMIAESGRTLGTINGIDIQHLPNSFSIIGQLKLIKFEGGGAITLPIIYALILIIIFSYLMSNNSTFRKYYYIGINKKAAILSGINVKRMKTIGFVISASLAGFSGVILCARMASGAVGLGVGMEMNAVTAAVIGGVSIKGGSGSVLGAVLGTLFIICLNNGLRIGEVPSEMYKVIQGCVLLIALIIDASFSRRKVVG